MNKLRKLTALIALGIASSSSAQTGDAPATIFEHTDFGGRSQALVEGMNVGPLALGNDVASSVKVSKCFKVTLYGAGPGQNGPELVLTADNADLRKDNFNDIVSNVLVERIPDCDAGAGAPAGGALSPLPVQIAAASGEPSATATARVVFSSSDGTAEFGSRPVFTLTNVATGAAVLVPVLGQKAATRTEVYVAPGEYTVGPPPASISDFMTVTTRDVSASRISATAGAPVEVRFSVSTQIAPLLLSASDITPDTVTLSWGVAKQVQVRDLVLVRTEGFVAATTPAGGTALDAGNTTDPKVVIRGLAPGRTYSFTLFATTADGKALPPRTLTIETQRADPLAAAFALAPNAMVPTDFASLQARRVGEHSVRVVLDANRMVRASQSQMPGIDAAATTSGCVVGAPFLLKTDVAGNESFWGTVDACGTDGAGATTAIINTDVPLSAVFDHYKLESGSEPSCYDAETGSDLAPEACNAPIAPETETSDPGQGALNLPRGTDLVRDQRYYNDFRSHYLVWQSDGNLVVYDANDRFVWGLNLYPDVNFAAIGRVSWQEDGNLAAYTADGQYIWSALHVIGGDAGLFINEAGTLQIIAGDAVLWRAEAPAPRAQIIEPPEDSASSIASREPAASPFIAASHWRGLPNPHYFLAASRRSKIKCEKSGSTIATLNPNIGPFNQMKVNLKDGALNWAFQVGVEASIDPQFEAEGGVECGLDLAGKAIQISNYPIPVNLELKPDISVSAQGKLAVRGPKITLKLGIDSKGSASGSVKTCTWFSIPCGVRANIDQKTKPIASLTKGSVTAVMQGTLTFKAGVEANLGLGVKNTFVTAKAGISMKLAPLSAELKAQAGTSRCINASLGYQLGADLLAEAYVLRFGDEKRVKLWESGHQAYPGAEFTIGKCADL